MRIGVLALFALGMLTACSLPVETGNAPLSIEGTPQASETKTTGQARHIGNAGLMIQQGDTKILFDPLYRNGYNNYHLVPKDVKQAVIAGQSPFDEIDAVLISHAHGDHFDALDLIAFHAENPGALIIAPVQAIETLEVTGKVTEAMRARFVPMGLEYGQDPLVVDFDGLLVEAVRIPHAGGPDRRALQNLVYRVTLEGAATVMHMGDADPALEHFSPYEQHWDARETGTAFAPYWFFLSNEGVTIVDETLNATRTIGVHVPVDLPLRLAATQRDYFAEPGATRNLSDN